MKLQKNLLIALFSTSVLHGFSFNQFPTITVPLLQNSPKATYALAGAGIALAGKYCYDTAVDWTKTVYQEYAAQKKAVSEIKNDKIYTIKVDISNKKNPLEIEELKIDKKVVGDALAKDLQDTPLSLPKNGVPTSSWTQKVLPIMHKARIAGRTIMHNPAALIGTIGIGALAALIAIKYPEIAIPGGIALSAVGLFAVNNWYEKYNKEKKQISHDDFVTQAISTILADARNNKSKILKQQIYTINLQGANRIVEKQGVGVLTKYSITQ